MSDDGWVKEVSILNSSTMKKKENKTAGKLKPDSTHMISHVLLVMILVNHVIAYTTNGI